MLIDYHNCSVYLLDGEVLHPVAVRGENAADIGLTTLQLGQGLTGHVAVSGKPMLVPNVRESDLCASVTGKEADESLASAPLRYGQRVIGAITLSKLGIGQFDEDDLRLLEVARRPCLGLARERAPLRLAPQGGRQREGLARVRGRRLRGPLRRGDRRRDRSHVSRLMEAEQCSMWLEDGHAADFRCIAEVGYAGDPLAAPFRSPTAWRALPRHISSTAARRRSSFSEDDVQQMFLAGEDRSSSRPRRSRRCTPGSACAAGSASARPKAISATSPTSACACSRVSRIALRSRSRSRCCSSPSRRAQRWRAHCSSSPAGWPASAGRTSCDRRIVELTGEMLGSPRTWLWLERGRPGSFAIALRVAGRRRRPDRPDR